MRWPELSLKGESGGRTTPHTRGVLLALPCCLPTEVWTVRASSVSHRMEAASSSRSLETAPSKSCSKESRLDGSSLEVETIPPCHLQDRAAARVLLQPQICSPEDTPSVFRPQHSFASLVHTDDVGAGGGPCHRIDGRASKGEVRTSVRP